MEATEGKLDQRIINLYDHFTHGGMGRRRFMTRMSAFAGGSAAASALVPLLESNYALAQTVPANDPRLATETFAVPGAGVNLNGYIAKPVGNARRPAVIVIHENRGLTPHIRDVTRRVALAGNVAFGFDGLSPQGGTPADEDQARDMFGRLQPPVVVSWLRATVAALRARPDVSGKVGAVGFCWGGSRVNDLAVAEPTLDAGVAYYGGQPPADAVPAIRAPLLLHYAGLDERLNAGIPAYEAALRQHGKRYELFMYPGVNHAFNNDTSAARFDRAAAELAWTRTIGFFRRTLGATAS